MPPISNSHGCVPTVTSARGRRSSASTGRCFIAPPTRSIARGALVKSPTRYTPSCTASNRTRPAPIAAPVLRRPEQSRDLASRGARPALRRPLARAAKRRAAPRRRRAIRVRDPATDEGDPDRPRYLILVQQALAAAVAALAGRDRLRLACYYVQALTLAETGRVLSESEASASRHLARTRQAIRREVER